MLGIQAALAAQRGYKAEEGVLETRNGFFEVYGGVNGAVGGASVTRDLGKSWDIITDMAIKLVPGGHPYHALSEAAANAAREGEITPQDVESITVSRPGFTALTGPLHPTELIGMAHSPAYFLAAAVADRGFSWVHATAPKITDPTIHQLIDKIQVGAPPSDNIALYRQGATVTIRTKDGRTCTSTVYAPKGSGVNGIAWADVEAKYRALMPKAVLQGQRVEASLGVIHDLQREAKVATLIDLLGP
jgi:2-methylcitrate dehydratase PrpD